MPSIKEIKQLRGETGASPVDCKRALKEANGDFKKAKEILRIWGKEIAKEKKERAAKQGIIDSYVHPNLKVGVLLDIRCESDFVAKSKEFQNLAHEICLQIAAMNPLYVKPEDIPDKFLDGERKIYQEQFKNSGKPQKVIDEIVEGKLKKYKEEVSLLNQPWIKDQDRTIRELVAECISKTGENIEVREFARYEI